MLTGKSCHNQRIERLWKNVYDGMITYFYKLFYYFEDEGLLYMLDPVEVYILHNVFKDTINQRLTCWQHARNNHRIRTVSSIPFRLFTAGMMNNAPSEPWVNENNIHYPAGVPDHESPSNEWPVLSALRSDHIDDRCLELLNEQCPRNWMSHNHAVDVFIKAKRIVSSNERHWRSNIISGLALMIDNYYWRNT